MNPETGLIFYDGHCGLCHSAVRFALHRDPEGRLFKFAPLQGQTLIDRLSPEQRATLAESLVVLGRDGSVRQRSGAVVWMLEEIGGIWGLVGRILWLIPRPMRDLAYRGVARVRSRLFKRPTDLCPVVSTALENRFLP